VGRKPFPYISGYEALGDDVRAKRWLTFKPNELLDTERPVWTYRDELKTRKDVCEFVIKQFDYPLRWGRPTDVHYNNWFQSLCCHAITLDFWQRASETLRTLHLNKRKGKRGCGDCEDVAALCVTLMLVKGFIAQLVLGGVYRAERFLGGHGWGIFQDEEEDWRIHESTLDVPPAYPKGYPLIDPDENRWKVGKLTYEAWVKFDRGHYYEWEGSETGRRKLDKYLRLKREEKESLKKYEAIEEAWKRKTKALKARRKSLLARLRWRK